MVQPTPLNTKEATDHEAAGDTKNEQDKRVREEKKKQQKEKMGSEKQKQIRAAQDAGQVERRKDPRHESLEKELLRMNQAIQARLAVGSSVQPDAANGGGGISRGSGKGVLSRAGRKKL